MEPPKTKNHRLRITALNVLAQLTLAVSSQATDFIVANVNDSGPGSLRQAILNANANAGSDRIVFNIPDPGPYTIQPLSPLPAITDPVIINGYTQPGSKENTLAEGNNAILLIQLDGSGAGPGASGLEITAGDSTVRGLAINRFQFIGIWLKTAGRNLIAGNYVGTDTTGTVALGNAFAGICIGWLPPDISGGGNLVGGTEAKDRNIVSGNRYGVATIESSGNTVEGNFIGTDLSGTAGLLNSSAGVWIWDGSDNTIGGTSAGAGNLISGNRNPSGAGCGDSGFGIDLWAANRTVVQGNFIGTDITGTCRLPNGAGLVTGGSDAEFLIGGGTPGAGNLISGNAYTGLWVRGRTRVEGNFIGTDITGNTALGNGADGIVCEGQQNTIGGTVSGAGNVISGNDQYGVLLLGPGNRVQGNFIGTDITGSAPLGNLEGIMCESDHQEIGGAEPRARNVISGNSRWGLDLRGSGNVVQGNLIGTDVTGAVALGNGPGVNGCGVYMADVAMDNTIGGAAPGAGNVISGHASGGIWLSGPGVTGNRIQGNLIGTDVTGTQPLGNSIGIMMLNVADTLIGGTEEGAGNVIAASSAPYWSGAGVVLSPATATRIEGNHIGTDVTGTLNLGNVGGVLIGFDAVANAVGGTVSGAANTIAFNQHYGVLLYDWGGQTPIDNPIRGNSIYSNGGLGIDLTAGAYWDVHGPTLNDLGDADTGANNLQNFPVLTSVLSGADGTTIAGTLNSVPNTSFTLDFYSNASCDPSGYGEGETFIGSGIVTTDGSGNAGFTVTLPTMVCADRVLTATATDPTGNTSEFLQCMVARVPLDFVGFLPPIGGADGTGGTFAHPVRTFKLNSTVPVKFTAACGGEAVLSGVHRLQAIKFTDATTSGDPVDATPQDAATSGNQFRLAGGQWHFNLDTRATDLSAGIWQLVATLSDGSQHFVWIQIK